MPVRPPKSCAKSLPPEAKPSRARIRWRPPGGRAIIDTALEHFGRIDVLIHNAGNVRRASLGEMSYDDFDSVLDVHLRGAFHVVRPAFPLDVRRRVTAGSC